MVGGDWVLVGGTKFLCGDTGIQDKDAFLAENGILCINFHEIVRNFMGGDFSSFGILGGGSCSPPPTRENPEMAHWS